MRSTLPCFVRTLACAAWCLPLIAGCPPQGDSMLNPDAEPNGVDSTQVSFSDDIQPIFSAHCAECHRPDGFASGQVEMDLRPGFAHASIVTVASDEAPGRTRVIPGDPDASYLVEKVESDQPAAGARMPLFGAPLSDAELALLRSWIAAGAPNN